MKSELCGTAVASIILGDTIKEYRMISKITPDKVLRTDSSTVSWIGKFIPFMGGRPRRDTIITDDDIMNLIIACNTCSTLEEFFKVT